MTDGKKLMRGTLILAISNVLVKLIGAFYTIPLARMIGPEGMGIYGSAYQVYAWVYTISATGIPIAVSKLSSEELSKGNYRTAHKIFKVSFYTLFIISIISSLTIYFGAEHISNMIGNSRAKLAIMAIAPCVLFASVMTSFYGYFQGMQNMGPTAAGELTESVFRTMTGILLAGSLLAKGIEYSSAGAVIGVSIGSFFGMCLVILIYVIKRGAIFNKFSRNLSVKNQERNLRILLKIFKIALPITIGSAVFAVISMIDLSMIMRRLKEIGYTEEYAVKLYGYLTGYAYKIYSIPVTVILALAASIIPLISGAYARRNNKSMENIIQTGIRAVAIFALPAATGIFILSKPVLKLLFNDISAENLLRILSVAIIFVSIVQVTGAVLQGMGAVMASLKNLMAGAFLKVAINYVLIGIPDINILGAPIGTVVCYIAVTIFNLRTIKRISKLEFNYAGFFLKPFISSLLMGLGVLFSYNLSYFKWGSNTISVILSISIGIFIYLISILMIGGISRSDLALLPFGRKISKILFKLRLLSQ